MNYLIMIIINYLVSLLPFGLDITLRIKERSDHIGFILSLVWIYSRRWVLLRA